MSLSFDTALVFGVVGFYLFDSALLLHSNEVVFVKAGAQWHARRPFAGWLLMGKELYLPNPLTPAFPMVRSSWSVADGAKDAGSGAEALHPVLGALWPLAAMTRVLFSFMFIALPVVIFRLGAGAMLLAVFVLIYGVIAAMVAYAWKRRDTLGMDRGTLLRLSFDSLACPPFALNFVRKVSLHNSPSSDALRLGKEFLSAERYDELLANIEESVEELLAAEDEHGERHASLQRFKESMGKAERDIQ